MWTFAIAWGVGFLIYCGLAAYFVARFESNEHVALVGFSALGTGIVAIAIGMHAMIGRSTFRELRYGEHGTAGSIVALQMVVTTLFGAMASVVAVICGFIALSEGMRRLATWVGARKHD